ncbi:MAG: hydantoinase/oxoprolinase family protein [Rhodospirillales bacterium]|nr:hydantoinase/oxoprolinase family protein [Rhodospirillales bacterium]
MAPFKLGVDIGGTFTDIVLLGADGALFGKKILSTPDDYSLAIEEGVLELLTKASVSPEDIVAIAHGTTIATNAIIERRGATVALITTRGFRDVLELARFRTPKLYDMNFRRPDPLVERRLRFEVPERIDAHGGVVEPLDEAALAAVAAQIRDEGIQAVAVCFLNAYANPVHEERAVRILKEALPEASVSASTQFLPQIQEYERTSTTVVNAYLRPVVEGYVAALGKRLHAMGITAPFNIMQSSGGLVPATLAGANPALIIESGPAAGVVGCRRLGEQLGSGDLIVLDMGGTTAKASIIRDGELTIMPQSEVGGAALMGNRLLQGAGYPVQVPTIDIAEVCSGGGSIAWIDAGGGFQVGPQSAGAAPGPVCYDHSGTRPTVTDANLILGYLNPKALVGGELGLNAGKAREAIADLAASLGQAPVDVAYGIHQIANATMNRAMKAVTSEQGLDPQAFALVAIGGNGGVHACGLAEDLGVARIVVPPTAGLFSALGLLLADVEHQAVSALYRPLDAIVPDEVNGVLTPLLAEVERLLAADGFAGADARRIEVLADTKYVGQTWTLAIALEGVPVTDATLDALKSAFGDAHERAYHYRSDAEPVQLVALKVVGRGLAQSRDVALKPGERARAGPNETRDAFFGEDPGWLPCAVVGRGELGAEARPGPLIVEDYDSTIVVRPGWGARRDGAGNVDLAWGEDGQAWRAERTT